MEGNALEASIASKGEHSYYFAHNTARKGASHTERELQSIREDIVKLEALAETSYVKRMLSRERQVLENELKSVQERARQDAVVSAASTKTNAAEVKPSSANGAAAGSSKQSTPPPLPPAKKAAMYERLSKYAWDQTSSMVKIYIDWPNSSMLPANATHFGVEPTMVRFCVVDERADGGGSKELYINNLCHPIDVASSKLVIKEDRFILKLKKAATGKEWSNIDDTKDKKEAKRKARVERGELKGADTQALLADMYKNATDEERKGLREAAAKGALKREEDRKAKSNAAM